MYNNQLYHYGILGQKWGIRRYQNPDGTLTPAGKERYSAGSNKSAKDFVSSREKKKISDLSKDNSPEALAFAAIAVMLPIARYAIDVRVSRSLRKSSIKRQWDAIDRMKENEPEKWQKVVDEDNKRLDDMYKNRKIKSFSEAPKLSEKMSASDSLKHVNPGYPSVGRTMNCLFCTTSMALREKGYNVKATTVNVGFDRDEYFKRTFNAQTENLKKVKSSKELLSELSKIGDNAYGNLSIAWKLGGGHSVFWKNENGITRIYDAQDGTEYTKSNSSLNSIYKKAMPDRFSYCRLDNCKPTKYALAAVEPASDVDEKEKSK